MNSQKIPCATINPDASADSLEAKQPDVDNGTACYSKEGYFTTEYMAREWNKLWTDTWLIAGVISDIPKVGDYFLFDVGEESIIVTRTEDGVKAFYNVCSHRGAKLVWNERGSKKVFVCPFHSWSFHHTGELRKITDEDTFH
ncbi:MAG: Rieske (2Fe-2S) protein, partial [Halieaceae bacterium]|nr:Rieske (2Fe-2S) protein [Halieaceae bacterium]